MDLYHAGNSVKNLSSEYGVSEGTIYKRVKVFTGIYTYQLRGSGSLTPKELAEIEELIRLRYELPVYNTLKDAANDVRNKSYRAIYHQIDRALNDEQKNNIDQLFQIPDGATYSPWNEIKEDAKRATLSHLNDLIVRRNWLINHHIPTDLLQDVPYIKVKQMAAEAKTLGAFRMLEMESKKRYALTLAFVSMQLSKILDDIGEMFIKRMMSIHKKGRQRLKDHKEKTQKRTDSLISTLHELLLAYQTEGNPEERIKAMQKVLKEQEAQVLQDCENHLAFSGDNYYIFLWQFYKSHRIT
ncbi:hypothetical protein NKR17_09965 [Priestia flexa]|uniref:hypothetical protein n=1 Tax=Priestia flexa TaxID=86664 RepID=UPI00209E7B19|nr:hypothetical protein [Priestia flexa]MCP1189395.1 hypothetical protein [Priestia flexa]